MTRRAVIAGALCLQALGWPTRSQEVVAPAATSPDAIAAFGSVPLWKYHQSLQLPSVAACISGPYLTLASGIVQANFERHIVAPLGRSNMDLFGAFELRNSTASDPVLLSMATALNLVAWVPYSPQSYRRPCSQFKIGAARKSAAYGMAECAKLVYTQEKERGAIPYKWILRLRSDLAYSRALPPLPSWPQLRPSSEGALAPAAIWAPGKTDKEALPCVTDNFAVMTRAAMPLYFDALISAFDKCQFGPVPASHRGNVECLVGGVLEQGGVILPRSHLQLGTVAVRPDVVEKLDSWSCGDWPGRACGDLCSTRSTALLKWREGQRACDALAHATGDVFERVFEGDVGSAKCCTGRRERIARKQRRSHREEPTKGAKPRAQPTQRADNVSFVAICFSGHSRSMVYPEVFGNIAYSLIRPLGDRVDTFAALHKRSALYTEPSRIEAALRALGVTEKRVKYYSSDNISPTACMAKARANAATRLSREQKVGLSSPMSQAWGNLQCSNLVREEEKTGRRGRPYEWVIRARPDVAYGFRLPNLNMWPVMSVEDTTIVWAPAARGQVRWEQSSCVTDMLAIMNRAAMDIYFNQVFAAWQSCRFPKRMRFHGTTECMLGSILHRGGALVVASPTEESLKQTIVRPHVAPDFHGCAAGKKWSCEGRCSGPKGLVHSHRNDTDIKQACAVFESAAKGKVFDLFSNLRDPLLEPSRL